MHEIEKLAERYRSFLKKFFDPRLAGLAPYSNRLKSFSRTVDCVKNGSKFVQLQVFLVTSACAHSLRSGCSMCGFWAYSTGRHPVPAEALLAQFEREYLPNRGLIDDAIIYNNGSFFDESQVPAEVRRRIFTLLATDPRLKEITLETRPEYLTAGELAELRALVPRQEVEVCLGLETSDPISSQISINKGYTFEEYRRGIALLHGHGYKTLTYNLLKLPFLTEAEAIAEAVGTTRAAFEAGSDAVSLEAAFVQAGSFLELLRRRGLFAPPSYWSVIETLRRVAGSGEVRLGYFSDEPPPLEVPRGCPNCEAEATRRFELYRDHGDASIFDGFDCVCRADWERELQAAAPPLAERVAAFLTAMEA